MVNPITDKQNFFKRGGILCLLSFWLVPNFTAAQRIICLANKDLQSANYGQIAISGLGEEIEQFKSTAFSSGEWRKFFTVKVVGATRPMLGSYEVRGSDLVFTPRFLPDPQVSYEAHFSSDALRRLLPNFSLTGESSWVLRFDRDTQNSAEVIGVFPESDMLPANILRLYVEFSEPMSFENPHDYLRIEDKEGRLLMEPFVEIEEGLWNANRTRLTLLFHPGRIKRGVGLNMTQGVIFAPNQKYTLRIANAWSAASGDSLKSSFTKTFQTSEPIRETINIDSWKITTPKVYTDQPLVVQVDRLLDKALAERMVSVIDENGNTVDGAFEFNGRNMRLLFTAGTKWGAGVYQISVNPKLEDVCGNTLLNVFDLEGSGQKISEGNRNLTFTIE